MLQLREKEIFETLKNMKKFDFVVIGGYAVNAYTLPRFSVDCDIVLQKRNLLMEKSLKQQGYVRKEKADVPYGGEFLRYEKIIKKGFMVSMDILVKEVFDRQTNTKFTSEWIFNHSSSKILKGKTISEEIKIDIIDIDALIVMKIISCRNPDIRDVFMLIPSTKNKEWVKKEISSRCNFRDRFDKLKNKISSKKFKDDLQGVYGYIDEKIFEKHKKAILGLE